MDLGVECLRRTADRRRAELGQPLLDRVGVQRRDEIMREFLDQLAVLLEWDAEVTRNRAARKFRGALLSVGGPPGRN